MSFVQDKGWVAEPLGLKSGHWKCLARKNNKSSPTERVSPSKTKRTGPVPLQELDLYVLNTKRKKRKTQEEKDLDERELTIGSEAVVAMQHRRAQ